MTDQKFLDKVEQANTSRKVLALILENEDFLGYDPYYADLRKAMLQQAQHVWEVEEREGAKMTKTTLFEVTTDNVDFVVGEVVNVELSDEARESLYRLVRAALAVYLKEQAEELILDQLMDLIKEEK